MTPTIGRIVHYNTQRGGVFPAVVVKVYADGGLVDLFVMTHTGHFNAEMVHEGEDQGDWFWPPRVA